MAISGSYTDSDDRERQRSGQIGSHTSQSSQQSANE